MSTTDGTGSDQSVADQSSNGQDLPGPGPARGTTVRQVALGAVVLVFMVGGIAVPLALLSGSLEPSASTQGGDGPGSAPPASPLAPDTALVACTDQGTEVLTPVVRPQPDGVHFRTDNRTNLSLLFDFEASEGGVFGTNAPPGDHAVDADTGFALAPGEIKVRCADTEDPDWPDTPWSTLTVEDPEGLWAPASVEGCDLVSNGIVDYAQDAVGEQGDPVDIARRELGGSLEPGDEVRAAGYPESAQPTVAVVRDERVVMVVQYVPDSQGGWLRSETTACAD
jgi:hypothetical protein